MINYQKYAHVSPCEYADGLQREQFVDQGIRELWPQIPRIAGPAYTVKCGPGDHLMLHAAIYRANPGDIIVVQADPDFAVAGGNVCAIAKQRGITGFVVDGVIRDLAEVREMQFPVFARGVVPKPGSKNHVLPLNQTIICGGVKVDPGDIIIADEEGIAVVPLAQAEEIYQIAKVRAEKDASMSLDEWQDAHHKKVESRLAELGYE